MGEEVLRPIRIVDENKESPDYQPNTGIKIRPNWPKPKIKGHGVVRDKDGNIKSKFKIKED